MASAEITITPPDFRVLKIKICGTAPLVLAKFSQKAAIMMREKHEAGATAKSKKAREKRDFDADMQGALYRSKNGKYGFNASSIRNACISACRTVGVPMTRAKLAIFVVADGFDVESGTPLVFITKGEPENYIAHTRNATGVIDLRARPMWREGWEATLTIRYDAGMMDATTVVNLISRVGVQVGIGEGRPDSKSSAGLGFGLFEIVNDEEQAAA